MSICRLRRAAAILDYKIRAIDRKQEVPHDGPMCDLLWSDPDGECDFCSNPVLVFFSTILYGPVGSFCVCVSSFVPFLSDMSTRLLAFRMFFYKRTL